MSKSVLRFGLIFIIAITSIYNSNCQSDIPEALKKEGIQEQLKYLEEHTRIYENYRAIREDMFRLISKNTIDTINNAKNKIKNLSTHIVSLDARIDSLNSLLEATNTNLDEATRTKENIKVLGIGVNKTTYNSIMWSILGILLLLLIIGYFTFKQNRSVTVRTKKDFEDLKTEFEEYKKKARLEREKTTMDHFNEIKKLKAGLPGSRS